ncbi:MAG: Rnf-Nqr domain containing protein [Acholeplasma sp.]|nr:Rnf-Nqr domain containing protein [Acholeplasma sp.]
MTYLAIIFSSVFISNIVLSSLIGLPVFDKETKLKDLGSNILSLLIVVIISSMIVYPVYDLLLKPEGWEFLTPLFSILVVRNVKLLVNLVFERVKLPYNKKFFGISEISTAVIFTSMLLLVNNPTFLESVFQGIGLVLGYGLVMVLVFTIKPRLDLPGGPKSFQGIPILLVTLGLVAMVFLGLAGIL